MASGRASVENREVAVGVAAPDAVAAAPPPLKKAAAVAVAGEVAVACWRRVAPAGVVHRTWERRS